MSPNPEVGSRMTDAKDPCAKERQMSMDCIQQNNYDKGKCAHFFDNFKVCKSFWVSVEKLRRSKGISPYLPPPEERDRIKKIYLETGKIPETG